MIYLFLGFWLIDIQHCRQKLNIMFIYSHDAWGLFFFALFLLFFGVGGEVKRKEIQET